MNGIAVNKLELVPAAIFQLGYRDAQLFLALANCANLGRFAGINLTAGSVDLAFAQAGFFVNQQDFTIADYKYQRGRVPGLPGFPVDVFEFLDGRLIDDGLPQNRSATTKSFISSCFAVARFHLRFQLSPGAVWQQPYTV